MTVRAARRGVPRVVEKACGDGTSRGVAAGRRFAVFTTRTCSLASWTIAGHRIRPLDRDASPLMIGQMVESATTMTHPHHESPGGRTGRVVLFLRSVRDVPVRDLGETSP